jgi:nitroimidazol reductase NimA-like FMN-containing flavoprotein (pyridoxamine 5'-phosphate oxidase superfamily)
MPAFKRDRVSNMTVGRPYIPGYGVPHNKKGMLPWSFVTERLAEAKNYWICTTDPLGRPHATPVWGMWLDEQLYFGGGADTRRNRNLVANPAVCVHLESGSEVVIVHGEAQALRAAPHELAVRLSEASAQKYAYAPKPEEYEADAGGTFVMRPRVVLAWKQFPKDAARWEFRHGG